MSRAPIKLKRKPPEWKPFDSASDEVVRSAKIPRGIDSMSAPDSELDIDRLRKQVSLYGCGKAQRVLSSYLLPALSGIVCEYDYGTCEVMSSSSNPIELEKMPEMKHYKDMDEKYMDEWILAVAKHTKKIYYESSIHKGLRGFSSIKVDIYSNGNSEAVYNIGSTFETALHHVGQLSRREWLKWVDRPTLFFRISDNRTDRLRGFSMCMQFKEFYDLFCSA
jgi:hypothetical protein